MNIFFNSQYVIIASNDNNLVYDKFVLTLVVSMKSKRYISDIETNRISDLDLRLFIINRCNKN